MTKHPVSVHSDVSVKDAAIKMKNFRVSSLIIIAKDKSVQGIITVDDIVRLVVAKGLNSEKTSVKDVMTKNVITITPDKSVDEVVTVFIDNDIRQIPVVSDGSKLEGFVTLKDILRFEPALFDLAVNSFKVEEERRQQEISKLASESFSDEDDDLFN